MRRNSTDREPNAETTTTSMTDHTGTDTDRNDYRPTLGEVSHTNPYTDRVFGDTQTYGRGKTVAADGGAAGAADDADTLADVSHTPPNDSGSAQRAYDRGGSR